MRANRTIGAAILVTASGLLTLGGCDLVINVGTYCTVGVDPGCGASDTGGTGGAGGETTSSSAGASTGGTTTGGGGSGGTTTTSSTGGTPECTAGGMQDCYAGPPGTQGIGVCKGGTQTCQQDGTWGVCEGDVLPGTETCATDDDEDCNGTECALWSRIFGDTDNQTPLAVAVDSNDNTIVVGWFTGQIDIDGKMLMAGVDADLFLVKFDPNGVVLWAKMLGDAASQTSASIAVDSAGNIVLAGSFSGQIDFGGGHVVTNSTPGTDDMYLTRLDSAGNCIWANSYGDAADQSLYDVATDALGDIAIVAAFKGTVNLGKGDLTAAGTGHDVLVAKIGSDGNTVWNKKFGDQSSQFGKLIAIGPGGNVYVAGQFGGTIDLGDGPQTDSTAGGADIFLANLAAADGSLVSKKIMPTSFVVIPTGLAVDAAGRVTWTGDLGGTFNPGGGAYTPAGGYDSLLVQYDANWSFSWGHQLGSGSANEGSTGLVVDKDGRLAVAMASDGGIDFGGGAILSSGSTDVFVAVYNSSGQHLWSRKFGDPSAQSLGKLAVFADGSWALACKIDGSFDFGAGAVASNGNDVAVVKLAP